MLSWIRKWKFAQMLRLYRSRYSVGPTTVLLPGFRIIDPYSPTKRLQIGNDCVLAGTIVFETPDQGRIHIGNRCHIGGGTQLISRAEIVVEDDVTIAWNCTVYDHDSHSLYWDERQKDTLQEVAAYAATGNPIANKDWSHVNTKSIRIGKRAWLGFGVTVLKGVEIGEGAVIGAGSVVTRNVPPYTVAAGNPARIVKELPKPKEDA